MGSRCGRHNRSGCAAAVRTHLWLWTKVFLKLRARHRARRVRIESLKDPLEEISRVFLLADDGAQV